MPDEIGMYLALTGRSVGPADAYRLRLATHCIPARRFAEIRAAVRDADPVDPVLDTRHEEPGPGELDAVRAGHCALLLGRQRRGHPGPARRRDAAARRPGPKAVRAELTQRSPLSLKVTYRQMRMARGSDLRAALINDFRLVCRFLEGEDFYEGVRAFLVDRDRKPRWRPGRLQDVTEAMVDGYFAPLGPTSCSWPPTPRCWASSAELWRSELLSVVNPLY